MPESINPDQKPERKGPKSIPCVRAKRKRVSALTSDQRKQITWLFDHWQGDADHVADRCGIIGVQRADVLAVVLADTRRKGPEWEQGGAVLPIRRIA